MTDRELLEMAAKAAGITNLQWESDGSMQNRMNRLTIPYECQGMMTGIDWNPLRDDGDALRLAVMLSIRLTEFKDTVVKSRGVAWKEGYASCSLWEPEGTNPYAATRRAIVRAAASMGEKL